MIAFLSIVVCFLLAGKSWAFSLVPNGCNSDRTRTIAVARPALLRTNGQFSFQSSTTSRRFSSPDNSNNNENASPTSSTATTTVEKEVNEKQQQQQQEAWYEIPEDAVIQIRPNAMKRLEELRAQQGKDEIYLRMGVKSGGCSGMSYVMDFCQEADITEDDVVDDYDQVKCVVDPKSVLYLYGLELDYSSELIGGGFKFFNPNAEESCGCGSSFGI